MVYFLTHYLLEGDPQRLLWLQRAPCFECRPKSSSRCDNLFSAMTATNSSLSGICVLLPPSLSWLETVGPMEYDGGDTMSILICSHIASFCFLILESWLPPGVTATRLSCCNTSKPYEEAQKDETPTKRRKSHGETPSSQPASDPSECSMDPKNFLV